MTRSFTILSELEEQRKTIESDARWSMIFYELCEDGFIRPVSVHPHKVTCIKRPDKSVDSTKWIHDGGYSEGTVVIQDGREILLHEPFRMVISALGTMATASETIMSRTVYQPLDYEQRGISIHQNASCTKRTDVQ